MVDVDGSGAAPARAGGTRAGVLAAASRSGGADATTSGAEAAPLVAVDGAIDAHAPASAPATSAAAIARNPSDGPQRPVFGSWRGGLATEQPGERQGAGVLDVDTFQPMRSWPYWFQIGLLPPVYDA